MIIVRPVAINEAPLLHRLELRIWSECIQATPEQLTARISAFPDGVVGIWVQECLVGFGTSQIVRYSERLSPLELEKLLPRHGVVSLNHDSKGNCLHFMSGGILPEFRRRGLWTLLVQYRLALAKMLNLEWAIVDSRMPSFVTRSDRYRTQSAEAYATMLDNGRPIDPYLAFFFNLGFRLVAPVPSSYSDAESGHIWPFMALRIRGRSTP